jgi:hypothetical protein
MKIYVAKNNVKLEKIIDDYFLIPVNQNVNKIIQLNETACFIWENTNGKNTAEKIAEQMIDVYAIDYNTALSDILFFYSEIKEFLYYTEE